MNIDDLQFMSVLSENKNVTDSAYSCVVGLIQSEGSQIDFWQVDRAKSNTRVDISDKCFSN